MKRTVYLLTMLLISAFVSAQNVDFSGSWKLNNSKSKLGDQFSMAANKIVVVQNGNNLSVEKHSSFQDQEFTTTDKLTLDGKECTNTGFMDTEKKSIAIWDIDKKSISITSKIPIQGETMTITEIFKLDENNLVIETKAASSYGEMEETMVYDKE